MKKMLIIIALFVGTVASAQSKQSEIDQQVANYNETVNAAVADEMEYEFPHLKTTCPLMLPAIGAVSHEVDIYFDLVQNEMDDDRDANQQYAIIRKATFKLESGSYLFEFNFHFNEIGMLIYQSEYMEDASMGCQLSAYYFDKEACFFVRTTQVATDFCEVPAENQPEERTKLTALDQDNVNWILTNATKFKQILSLYADLFLN